MDKDCVAILMRMYGGEDGPTKNDLMEYWDLFASFLEMRRKVRKCCRMWLWTISLGMFVGLKDTWIQRERWIINNCDCSGVWYWS
jgi:hypothetical protein